MSKKPKTLNPKMERMTSWAQVRSLERWKVKTYIHNRMDPSNLKLRKTMILNKASITNLTTNRRRQL